MTKYCLQERAKVYEAYLNYFFNSTKENWLEYIKLVDNFKYKFHKRFDPLNLIDDYDILEITLRREEGKPFIPMELKKTIFNIITEDYVSFITMAKELMRSFRDSSEECVYDVYHDTNTGHYSQCRRGREDEDEQDIDESSWHVQGMIK